MTADEALKQLSSLCRLWGAEVESPDSIVKAVEERLAYHEKHEAELYAFQVPLIAQRDGLKRELHSSNEVLGWVVERINDVLDSPIHSSDGGKSVTLGNTSGDGEAYLLAFTVGTMKRIKDVHSRARG